MGCVGGWLGWKRIVSESWNRVYDRPEKKNLRLRLSCDYIIIL